jgi:hypothetical protein
MLPERTPLRPGTGALRGLPAPVANSSEGSDCVQGLNRICLERVTFTNSMTSHELFAAMPAALALDILEFNRANDKKLYRAALDAVASARKWRSVFLERQPWPERYSMMVASLSRPALGVAADTLLRNWLLKKHTALLADFLDALAIKHDKGVVEELPKSVEDGALKMAVETLLAKHPAEAVAVYLHAFNSMNAESWGNLEALLQSEPRLRLKPAA